MKEFVKRCGNCEYLGITKFTSEDGVVKKCNKYTCKSINSNEFNIESLDGYCDCYRPSIALRHVEEGVILSEEEHSTLTEEEKDSVREIAKVLEFIKENKLENVNFKYDQVRGIATVNGVKDGYKYSTMISFKRGDKENDK